MSRKLNWKEVLSIYKRSELIQILQTIMLHYNNIILIKIVGIQIQLEHILRKESMTQRKKHTLYIWNRSSSLERTSSLHQNSFSFIILVIIFLLPSTDNLYSRPLFLVSLNSFD